MLELLDEEDTMGFWANLFGKGEPKPTAAELKAAGAKVLDVRSRAEYQSGHVAGARSMDVGSFDFASQAKRLNPKHTYVVYCQSGSRSARAAAQLRAAGLTVVDGGGIGAMQRNGWTLGA
jgi:rhodanese-related sulfurtransferase